MKRFILSLVALVAVALFVSDASAGIFSWLFGRTYRPRPVVTTPAQPGVRAYSYEPGVPAASPVYTESGGHRLNAWDYPKTDSRRYNGGR